MPVNGVIFGPVTNFEFLSLDGNIQATGKKVEDLTRKGVDGHAFRKIGRRGEIFEMIGKRDCDDQAAAGAFYQQIIDECQGELVSVLDSHGNSAANVMVHEVINEGIRPIVSAVGGISTGQGAWLVLRFRMQLSGIV